MRRPTKLTEDVQYRIVAAIRAGSYAAAAVRSAGVSEATYYSWLARGRKELDDLDEIETLLEAIGLKPANREKRAERTRLLKERKTLNTDPGYREFRKAVMRASAGAEVEALAVLRQAMTGWREQCAGCNGTGKVTVQEAAKSDVGKTQRSCTKATVRVCSTCEGRGQIVRDPDWRAIAWYLERRHPDRWRRRESHEVEHYGSQTAAVIQRVGGIGDPAHTKAAHDFLRAIGDARGPGDHA